MSAAEHLSAVPPSPDEPPPVQVALARVMAEVRAVGKDRRMDPKAGGYAYRAVDDVYDAVQGPLSRHGVIILPDVEKLDITTGMGSSGSERHVAVKLRVRIIGPAGDELMFVAHGEGMDRRDRATQKAVTDADKYAVLRALRIRVTGDDSDETGGEPAQWHSQQPQRAAQPEPEPDPDAYPGDDPDRRKSDQEHKDVIADVERRGAALLQAGVINEEQWADARNYARRSLANAHAMVARFDDLGRPSAEQSKPSNADDAKFHRWEMATLSAAGVDDKLRHDLAKLISSGRTDTTDGLSRDERRQRAATADRIKAGSVEAVYDAEGVLRLVDGDGEIVDPWALP